MIEKPLGIASLLTLNIGKGLTYFKGIYPAQTYHDRMKALLERSALKGKEKPKKRSKMDSILNSFFPKPRRQHNLRDWSL